MNFYEHPVITYGNYRCTYSADSFRINYCEINKSQINAKKITAEPCTYKRLSFYC